MHYGFVDNYKLESYGDKNYQLTKRIEIESEWRLFVWNNKIQGCKCYNGDEWLLPDKSYCIEIINNYDLPSYTLDVMIYKDKQDKHITDIIEIHDFFGCGLYGFNNSVLIKMLISSHIKKLKIAKY